MRSSTASPCVNTELNYKFCLAIDSAALAEKLLNDLLKTTEGFQRLKKMHEELKAQTSGNSVLDEGLKSEIERMQRENNQLHQQMINVKEETAIKIS